MKKVLAWVLLLAVSSASMAQTFDAKCDVMFSPRGNIEREVVKRIDASLWTLDVLAYSYTSNAIGEAIRRAHQRGVKVREIVDRTGPTQLGGEMKLDKAAGIEVYVDLKHRIAHNKVLVIDGIDVVTGSYNWSASANTVNSENILFCHSMLMAKLYTDRFNYLRSVSTLY